LEVQRLIGDDPLELAILFLELLEPTGVRDFHSTVLSLGSGGRCCLKPHAAGRAR